ncbi:MAG: hypothetical protein ABI855_02015 [Bacteroidota bacterium]
MKKTIYIFDSRRNRQLARKYARSKKFRGTTIILLALPLVIHKVTAVLNMPKGNADRGERAEAISEACATSTYVTVPPATISAIDISITTYKDATPATRVNDYRIMLNGLNALMRMFQDAADSAPDTAIAIIESGGFKVKKVAIPQKHEFEASNNAVSGVVDLTAPGGSPRSCHDWMYSRDEIVFERMQPTIGAETHKSGLTPGTYAYFTHELITKDGPQGISQIIKILVS